MNRIRLLSEQVANQIAAGEVVDRPASVVKELVENSLDAEATRLTIEIQAGGRGLIRVTDDGFGMSRDDALLCLERHATSKIRKAEELAAIASFGFRGEALPSIASISRFSLTTRERDSQNPDAVQVLIQGGKISEVRSAAGAAGSVIEVRQLFFNLPARRKFLRSEETERSHIQHYVMLAALAHPHVGFNFMSDQRVIWRLPPIPARLGTAGPLEALEERLRALAPGNPPLLRVDATGTLATDIHEAAPPETTDPPPAQSTPPPGQLRLWGVIGAPGASRATRESQHLFVNRRPVENRGLNYALLEGYHTALMKGRFPVCVLFLEIDPAAVDVNIHPAKKEVKFHQEMVVRRFVADAIRRVLLRFHAGAGAAAQPEIPRAGTTPLAHRELAKKIASVPGSAGSEQSRDEGFISATPQPEPELELGRSNDGIRGNFEPTHESKDFNAASTQKIVEPLGDGSSAAAELDSSAPVAETGQSRPQSATAIEVPPLGVSPPGSAAASTSPSQTIVPNSDPRLAPSRVDSGAPIPLLQVPLRLVGVIGRLYVVYESDRGMVLMDQHAAHERVLFEQMLRRLEQSPAPCQRLLLPETVELPPRDAQFIRENLASLTRLGVGLSEFGDRTFLLDGLPPFVKVADARRFVLELVDELKATGQDVNNLRLGELTVAKTVCRHAVKANDALSAAELDGLLGTLRLCSMPYTCPHGRPTLIEMPFRELEKRFGRQQL